MAANGQLPYDEHEQVLCREVVRLLGDGFEVKARLEGWFEEPDVIYGYRPDIFARKGDEILIVEVQKAATDWPKIQALQRFKEEHPKYQLQIIPVR